MGDYPVEGKLPMLPRATLLSSTTCAPHETLQTRHACQGNFFLIVLLHPDPQVQPVSSLNARGVGLLYLCVRFLADSVSLDVSRASCKDFDSRAEENRIEAHYALRCERSLSNGLTRQTIICRSLCRRLIRAYSQTDQEQRPSKRANEHDTADMRTRVDRQEMQEERSKWHGR